jgi:biopolymer transport protein ExbB/biopolymer transport protein TolQ
MVVGVLLIMSLVSLYIAAERWFTFFRMAKQSHQFAVVVADLLKDQRFQDAIDRAGERTYQFSYLARLISMGLREFEGLRGRSSRFDPADLIQRALDRAMYAEALGMRKGLAVLATVASTAPFVGLFGTIVGIIRSFQGMAAAEAAGVSPVFAGVAEALLTTAMGVLVAIPAIWAFNYLVDRVEGFEIQMNNSAAEIVDYCIKQIGVSRGQTNPNV